MKSSPAARRLSATVWLSAALLSLLVGGCGFQPRGQAPDAAGLPSPVFIAGISPYSELARELRHQLELARVDVAPSAVEGAAVLRIVRWGRDTSLLSVDSRNRAVEYELEESAVFSLHAHDGSELVGEQGIQVSRIQYVPETVVLGSSREAELLRGDMRRELAERIVRRLAAQY